MNKITIDKSKLDHIIGFVSGLYEGASFMRNQEDAKRVRDALSQLNEFIKDLPNSEVNTPTVDPINAQDVDAK